MANLNTYEELTQLEDVKRTVPPEVVEGFEGEKFQKPQCIVCLQAFEEGDDIKYLPCPGKHVFHNTCITEALTKFSAKCPVCRLDVRELASSAATPTGQTTQRPLQPNTSNALTATSSQLTTAPTHLSDEADDDLVQAALYMSLVDAGERSNSGPPGPACSPMQVVWRKYPALDSYGNDICIRKDLRNKVDLLKTAALEAGAVAFNSYGCLKSTVLPRNEWVNPAKLDMWVREDFTIPGEQVAWVRFRSLDSYGYDIEIRRDLEDDIPALQAAAIEVGAIAFNNYGCLKHHVKPICEWVNPAALDMWVRKDYAVANLGVSP